MVYFELVCGLFKTFHDLFRVGLGVGLRFGLRVSLGLLTDLKIYLRLVLELGLVCRLFWCYYRVDLRFL